MNNTVGSILHPFISGLCLGDTSALPRKISWGLKRMRFCLPDPSNQTSSRQPFKVQYHAGVFNIRDYVHWEKLSRN